MQPLLKREELNQFIEAVHYSLQYELTHYASTASLKTADIEACYMIVERHWSLLRSKVALHDFDDPGEEIRFFKEIKPRFTFEMEYYSLVFHCLLFLPYDLPGQAHFWQREGLRLERFKEEHETFYAYYKSGLTYKDEKFFLRENMRTFPETKPYDTDTNCLTSHDGLVATLLALERFTEYVQDKLKNLPTDTNS